MVSHVPPRKRTVEFKDQKIIYLSAYEGSERVRELGGATSQSELRGGQFSFGLGRVAVCA